VNARVRQRQATQASILKAALVEFSGKGFDGASTREIAARAGVHHALIKYHFKSKDLLWRAAVGYLFDREAELVIPPDMDDPAFADPKAYAREVLRRRTRYWAANPEHVRLIVQESCRESERLAWMVETHMSRWASSTRYFAKAMQANGLAPADAPASSIGYILAGATQLFFAVAPQARLLWGVDPTDPAVIEAHVETLVQMLLP